MAIVHLVRHGRPILGEGRRPDWSLDPDHLGEIDRLRESAVLPDCAGWFTSPERRAVETAARLGHPEAVIIQDFREQERPDEFIDEFPVVVERSLVFPDEPALPGWETVASVANRVLRALEAVEAGDKPLVLVGHGLAWILLAGQLTGLAPDLAAWGELRMPDHCSINSDIGDIEST